MKNKFGSMLGGLFGGKKDKAAPVQETSAEAAPAQANPQQLVQDTISRNHDSAVKLQGTITQTRFEVGQLPATADLTEERRQEIDQKLVDMQDELDRPLDVPHDLGAFDTLATQAIKAIPQLMAYCESAQVNKALEDIDEALSRSRRDGQETARKMGSLKLSCVHWTASVAIREATLEKNKEQIAESIQAQQAALANNDATGFTALSAQITELNNYTMQLVNSISTFKALITSAQTQLNMAVLALASKDDEVQQQALGALSSVNEEFLVQEQARNEELNRSMIEKLAQLRMEQKELREKAPVITSRDIEEAEKQKRMFATLNQPKAEASQEKPAEMEETVQEVNVQEEAAAEIEPTAL